MGLFAIAVDAFEASGAAAAVAFEASGTVGNFFVQVSSKADVASDAFGVAE